MVDPRENRSRLRARRIYLLEIVLWIFIEFK